MRNRKHSGPEYRQRIEFTKVLPGQSNLPKLPINLKAIKEIECLAMVERADIEISEFLDGQ